MEQEPDLSAALKAAAAAWGGVSKDPPQPVPPPVSIPVIPQPPPGAPGTPPPMSPMDRRALGEALVAMMEGVTPLAVRGWCSLKKVKWEPEFDKVTRLTTSERQSLMLTAPLAAPFVMKLLEKSDAIGAVFFAGTYVMICKSKVDTIAPPKPKEEPKVEEEADAGTGPDPAPQPAPAPVVPRRGRPKKV